MGTECTKAAPDKPLLAALSSLATEASRKRFFARHRRLFTPDFARGLTEAVVAQGRIDTHRGLALAEAAIFLSQKLGNKEIVGLSLRAKANALCLSGRNPQALEFYEQALGLFEAQGNQGQVARTLTSSLQALILLGHYDRAFAAAERARGIFTRMGEARPLARLENNVGNIYHRQDRFEEALASYERSYEQLLSFGDSQELATALSNMAMCLISLNDFPRALATYSRVRSFCDERKLPLLRAQADYNIAYLFHLRGEFSRAIEMLHEARHRCELSGDDYHFALCHLDLAEIFLELNLSIEAREMAHEGSVRFRKLAMGYEEAKCLAYEAMAFGQLGKTVSSLELFARARAIFVQEKNVVWPWLIDLYQALILFNEGRFFESRRLCLRAAEFFDASCLPGKAVLCHLLLARLALHTRDLATAGAECNQALDRLASLEAPVLRYQAHFLMGQVQQALGDARAAYDSCQKAREALETLRSRLRGEELKIAFMKNRLELYEVLVELCLNDGARKHSADESFLYIELAKSRSLAELLLQGHPLAAAKEGQSDLVRRIRDMREELNWYYRRIEREQLSAEEPSRERLEKLQKQALARENELLRGLREFQVAQGEEIAGESCAVNPLENVRACLPSDAILIEYFSLRGQFVAAVLSRENLEILPLTPVSRATSLLRMLDFQLSKFRLGADYVRSFEKAIFDATQSHLRELYQELLGPFRDRLRGRHLVIVPHGPLHYLPFHALFDGHRYLIDSFTVSYAPSAGIFALCHGKPPSAATGSLVLGVPDSRAPFIQDEVQTVAEILPAAELIVGAEPCEKALRTKGLRSRLIHIATHGNFRRDNPLFSGIRLGSSYLNLYDLYQLQLAAELVTLSGCATGLNVVAAGDELLGLIRGLLHAGARSLLLSLWDVHDRSTAEFMVCFYEHLQNGNGKAAALQHAMQQLRRRYAHPYYWAPFFLVGKVLPA